MGLLIRLPKSVHLPSRAFAASPAMVVLLAAGVLASTSNAWAQTKKPAPAKTKAPPTGGVTGPSLPKTAEKAKSGEASGTFGDAAESEGGWGDGSGSTGITLQSWGVDVEFPALPGDVFYVEGTVYESRTGKSLGEFKLSEEKNRRRALSPDGKHLALVRDQQGSQILEIYELDGGPPQDIPLSKEKVRIDYHQFISPTRLIAAVRGKKTHLITWDLEKNKIFRDVALAIDPGSETVLSASGKYLAVPGPRDLSVLDVATGKRLATMAPPPNIEGLVFLGMNAFAFSPDDKELAALTGDNRIIVWSNKGKIVYDEVCARVPHSFASSRRLLWFPEGNAWLVSGRAIFERETKMVVFEFADSTPYPSHLPGAILDQTHLLTAAGAGNRGEYQITQVPWDEIKQTVESALNDKDPIIGPGRAVSIEVQVGQVRFAAADEVKRQLQSAVQKRLDATGISVRANQSSVIRVEYSEAVGQTKDVVNGIGFAAQKTGIKITDTVGALKISLDAGAAKPYWQFERSGSSGLFLKGEPNDSSVRKEMFESILAQISQIELPTYIPRNPRAPSLPIVHGHK